MDAARVAVVGLGLIGGSMAKALKKKTGCTVLGLDRDGPTLEKALAAGAIDQAAQPADLAGCQLVFIALYPGDTVDFVRSALEKGQLSPGTILSDLCGIKRYLQDSLALPCREKGVHYIGAHPMAGRETSGFDSALDNLYDNASVVLTPDSGADPAALEALRQLLRELGFGRIVQTSPEHHDRMIAYTSQLAHVLSSAYIQNPLSTAYSGFTGGSFQDLTRVARLNCDMWGELFDRNRDLLCQQLDVLIELLGEYRTALENRDEPALRFLMERGTRIKNQLLEERQQADLSVE